MKNNDTKRHTATLVLFITWQLHCCFSWNVSVSTELNGCSYDILLQHPPSPMAVVRPFIVGEVVSYLGNSLLLACC